MKVRIQKCDFISMEGYWTRGGFGERMFLAHEQFNIFSERMGRFQPHMEYIGFRIVFPAVTNFRHRLIKQIELNLACEGF